MSQFLDREPSNLEEKLELLMIVEDIFKKHADVYASKKVKINEPGENYGKLDTSKVNLCCDASTREEIISFGDLIKKVPKFSSLKFFEIYISLLFTYYALRYNEPVNFEWLYSKDLFSLFEGMLNDKEMQNLVYDITSGDIDINLSSIIRRTALEMKGGKKSRKSRKSKTQRKRRFL